MTDKTAKKKKKLQDWEFMLPSTWEQIVDLHWTTRGHNLAGIASLWDFPRLVLQQRPLIGPNTHMGLSPDQ